MTDTSTTLSPFSFYWKGAHLEVYRCGSDWVWTIVPPGSYADIQKQDEDYLDGLFDIINDGYADLDPIDLINKLIELPRLCV